MNAIPFIDALKNRIEVLLPAGLLSLDELIIKTDLIRKRHKIIKPGNKTIHSMDPMGEQINSIKKEEVKWNSCYLQQRYGVSEKLEIFTLLHAIIQADGISCGVFCLKITLRLLTFAENYINGEVLVRVFPLKEVNAYRKREKEGL
nr:uncharacterized protein LOC124817236 [Hydra vulgaris]